MSTEQPPPPTGSPLSESEAPPSFPQPPPSPAEAGWGPSRVLLGLLLFLVVVFFEATVIQFFDRDIDTLAGRLTLQGLLGISLIAVAFAAASPGAQVFSAPAALGWQRPKRGWIRPTLIAYFGYVACALVLAALLSPEQEDITRELGFDEGGAAAVAVGLLVIVVAPLSEEFFFRGFIFTGLRRGMPVLIAAVISSAVWGLFHYTGPDSWAVCLQLAIFGLFLCWLYQRTGSIWPPIGVHAFNNALAFILLTST